MRVLFFALCTLCLVACGGGSTPATDTKEEQQEEVTPRSETKSTAMEMTQTIKLLKPDTQCSKPLMKAMAERKSTRQFAPTPLSLEEVSDIMWAASGITHEAKKQTAPSAMALYPIEVYAFFEQGVWRYDPASHTLVKVLDGDHRQVTAMQDFAWNAPLNIVYIANYSKYDDKPMPHEQMRLFCGMDAAGYAQNVSLYSAASGLKSVVRASAPKDELVETLKLSLIRYEFMLAQTVGR